MRILIACEESQAVTSELRKLGHEAFSCDIQPTSGQHPEWHLQMDVRGLLKQKWDAVIAFPLCTDLASSGARHFERKRKDGSQARSIEFFKLFTELECPIVVIENPVGIMSREYRKPDQIIEPYQFGHPETKKTCLWLKGVPKLAPTKIVEPDFMRDENGKIKLDKKGKKYSRTHFNSGFMPDEERRKLRSKTYPGIAKAMAEQWFGVAK